MAEPELAAQQYLEQMDLSYVRARMCSEYYELPRWSSPLIDTCETLYKRFLWLMVSYPNEPLVPTKSIDEFWHNHILFTKAYIQDCQHLAGRYLHHAPSDPGDNVEQLAQQFAHTQQRYQDTFGEPLKVLVRD